MTFNIDQVCRVGYSEKTSGLFGGSCLCGVLCGVFLDFDVVKYLLWVVPGSESCSSYFSSVLDGVVDIACQGLAGI